MTNDELPDWTTKMDEEILRVLASELILTPAVIAENIDRSREVVSRRLNTLEAGELVEKVERGKYRISDKAFLLIAEPVETSIESNEKQHRKITTIRKEPKKE